MATISIVDDELPYDTHNTYTVTCFTSSIFTTVTHDLSIVTRWISEIDSSNSLIVGLDIEWRPNYSRNIDNPAATLQLCVSNRCLIFQPIHAPSIPTALVNFLANQNHTFVGVGIKADLEKLQEDYEFGFRMNCVDLRGLAAEKMNQSELKRAGLQTLARVVLEKDVPKPKRVTMSRWDNQWLTPDQVQYACIDAYLCREIGETLKNAH